MAMTGQLEEKSARQGFLGLAGLIVGLTVGAVALRAVAGPPNLPNEVPSWDVVVMTLRGSDPPLDALTYLLQTAAWAVWFWVVISLAVRLVIVSFDAATHGAAWVRSLRSVSDRLTLPIVRRLVDGALVAVIVVNLVGRSVPAAAAPAASPATAISFTREADEAELRQSSSLAEKDGERAGATYAVESGDTLWAIAEHFYGSGFEYPRLVAANAGQLMSDGRRFTNAGVIRPGWVLTIPPLDISDTGLQDRDAYVVQPGDTLASIAAQLLGDRSRWPEIFELNRGKAALPDGRVFTNPDLIWPGLGLQLPSAEEETPSETPEDTPSPPTDAPVGEEAPTPAPERPGRDRGQSPLVPVPPPAPDDFTDVPGAGLVPPPVHSPPTATLEPNGTLLAPPAAPAPRLPAVPAETATRSSEESFPPALMYGGAAAAAAIAGGAAVLVRRRVRRSLDEPPVRLVKAERPPGEDFTEAEPARVLTHCLDDGEMEPVDLAAAHTLRHFNDHGVHQASVVMAQQGRRSMTLTLSTSLGEQVRSLTLAKEVVRQLGGRGWATVTPQHDILIHVSSLAFTRLAAMAHPPVHTLRLLPLGMLPDRETLYGNWNELGHVLVAGLPGGGTEVVLTSLVATLTARCRPDELRLQTIASPSPLPTQLYGLPHQSCDVIDPTDEAGVRTALEGIREELLRRMREAELNGSRGWQRRPDEPELVLMVGELGDISHDGTTLELIGIHGAAIGVRLLAGTTRVEAVSEHELAHFETRFALQTLDDDESIYLLGEPDAADLGPGEFLVRIAGRPSINARGFRISSEHLDELMRLMRQTYEDDIIANGRVDPSQADASTPSPVETAILRADSNISLRREEQGTSEEQRSTPSERIESAKPSSRPKPSPQTGADESANGGQGEPVPLPDALKTTGVMDGEDAPETRCPLQVRCLGEFVVTSGDREVTPTGEEGASYKAWEILAFLAAHPGGVVSKENLITAIWPDIETGRAANRMRVAMTRLRALLARQVPGVTADVVRCERDGTCRLDNDLVWLDVHEFLELCQAASELAPEEAKVKLQRALALYRGDLLSGRGTRFYEWVHERTATGVSLQEHYREEYFRATQRLAQLYRQDGQVATAVAQYKALLKFEPTLEDIVRELYRCYQELEDLSSLIREDRRLRQALREAFDEPVDSVDDPDYYQPEPATVALFNEVRTDLEAKAAHARGDGHPAHGHA